MLQKLSLFALMILLTDPCFSQPGGPGGQETIYIKINPQSICVDPEENPEDEYCPDDLEAIALFVDGVSPGYPGTSCNFSQQCVARSVPYPAGLPQKVCTGEEIGDETGVDVEIVIINSGAATAVPKYHNIEPGIIGRRLDEIDTINCFKTSECKCVQRPVGPVFDCARGEVRMYFLARYQINQTFECTIEPPVE